MNMADSLTKLILDAIYPGGCLFSIKLYMFTYEIIEHF